MSEDEYKFILTQEEAARIYSQIKANRDRLILTHAEKSKTLSGVVAFEIDSSIKQQRSFAGVLESLGYDVLDEKGGHGSIILALKESGVIKGEHPKDEKRPSVTVFAVDLSVLRQIAESKGINRSTA